VFALADEPRHDRPNDRADVIRAAHLKREARPITSLDVLDDWAKVASGQSEYQQPGARHVGFDGISDVEALLDPTSVSLYPSVHGSFAIDKPGQPGEIRRRRRCGIE
jgi:hypothetical protein